MPALDPAEWLELLPELDLSAARVAPNEAARSLAVTPTRLEIAMLGDRPVYRFAADGRSATVFADDGARLQALGDDEVMRLARALFPEHAATAQAGSPPRVIRSVDPGEPRRAPASSHHTGRRPGHLGLPLRAHRRAGDDRYTKRATARLCQRHSSLALRDSAASARRGVGTAGDRALTSWRRARRHGPPRRSLAAATRSRTIGKHRTRFALRRPHALAPLRGPGIRPLHLHLGGERLPVDGSLELALRHRSHH